MTATTDLAVAVWPGIEPRLLRRGTESTRIFADYRNAGGYQPLDDVRSPAQPGRPVRRARPRRRGVPAGREAADGPRQRPRAGGAVVVANGEEGEPASIKDRWLLRNRPHLVLDGLRLAARMVSAERAYVYVSDPGAAACGQTALAAIDREVLGGLSITMLTVDPGYVAGEETAAVRALNGGPAKPTDKPPRPFEEGVGRLPTMVSNVETLALIPFLHRHGAEAFRCQGTSTSPGTFLATITGAGRPPALYEIPHGLPFTELLDFHGVPADQVHGVLMGGYFAGLLNRDILDVTLDHESLRRLDSGLGCGAITDPHRRLPGGGRRRR